MSEALEFVLLLFVGLLIAMVCGILIAVKWRARMEARRIKRHFASKRQPGRPTQ